MRFTCAGILALAMGLGFSLQAVSQAAETEFPACHSVRIVSPNRNWELTSNTIAMNCPGQKGNSQVNLLLKNKRTGRIRKIGLLGWGGAVRWAPDSAAFSLNDYVASNDNEAYLYRVKDLKKVDLREAIRQSDHSVQRFMDGHTYFRVMRWLDNDRVLIDLCGHTDTLPVAQFDARYEVTLDGSVRKLSEKDGPPDEDECAVSASQ